MVGVDHVTFAELVDGVSDDLVLASPMSDRLHSLIAGIHLRRVANTNVVTKADLADLHLKSRRVWLGVSGPSSPNRLLDEDAVDATAAWQAILSSASFWISMVQPQTLPVQATADAMANTDFAGFGGAAIFPDGSWEPRR